MKRRSKRFLQKILSGILSLAIVLSGTSLPQMLVRAAETDGTNYIVGGDFTGVDWGTGKGKLGEWMLNEDYWETADVKTDKWAERENPPASDEDETEERGLGIWFNSAGTCEVYQIISQPLLAGTYQLTAYMKDDKATGTATAESFNGTS